MKEYVKVPVMMQMEALECGAVCLNMVLAYYGLFLPLEETRTVCGVSRDGSNMKSMFLAAQKYGLKPQAYRFTTEDLRTEAAYPCIIHWNFNHFVVLCGFKGNKAILNDPARGHVIISEKELDECFTGVVLTFERGPEFKPAGKPVSVLKFIMERMAGSRSMMTLVILTSLVATLMGVLLPGMQGFFADNILGGRNNGWTTPFYILFLVIAGLQLVAVWCKASYLLRLEGKMASVTNTSFIWHAICLPVEFFEQRMSGDVLERYNRNTTIVNTVILKLIPLCMDLISMIFYLAVMMLLNVPLAAIGAAGTAVNLWVSNVLAKKKINTTRVMTSVSGKLNSTTLAGIDMIETIKASGSEEQYFDKWADIYSGYQEQTIQNAKLDHTLGQIPQFVTMLCSNIVLIVGAGMVMNGSWLSGLVLAFTGYLSAFSTPSASLITSVQALQEMRTDMERTNDLMHYETDVDPNAEVSDNELSAQWDGRIELKDISFGYNPLKPPILSGISLSIQPGQRVAVVGSSGSGKSTIARLITGLYRPWSGEMRLDGIPLDEIPRPVLTAQIAYVNQNTMLFDDTVSNNIRLLDNTVKDIQVVKAAKEAQIHDVIIKREDGYQRILKNSGRDLSGGQQQRIEIATALVRDPSLLILDEATAGLDAETENDVMKGVAKLGITTLIISHRLSIVRDCDMIYVLDHGKMIDTGTHDELMSRCDIYRSMIYSN